jgi:hypothetical protein
VSSAPAVRTGAARRPAGPLHRLAGRGAGARVGPDRVGRVPGEERVAPHLVRREVDGGQLDVEAVGVLLEPGAQRLPDALGLGRAHAFEGQVEVERVVAADRDLLAPVLVAQAVVVERDEALEQLAERGVAGGDDRAAEVAEPLGEGMGHQRHAGDDAVGAAAAAAQRPQQIGVLARVGDHDLAVGGHDLGLEQAGRSDAVLPGPAAEPTALEEAARGADRGAAAALDVAAVLDGHRPVGLEPARTGLDIRAATHGEPSVHARSQRTAIQIPNTWIAPRWLVEPVTRIRSIRRLLPSSGMSM